MGRFNRLGLLLGWVILAWTQLAQASAPRPEFFLESIQYARDTNPATRFGLDLSWLSETRLSQDGTQSFLKAREFHFYSLIETGEAGDRSFDVDGTVFRFMPAPTGHLWLGRTHPWIEAGQRERVLATSAVGARWSQNQSNALSPRVAGWIGAGFSFRPLPGLRWTTAYSPIYLPTFGPRTDFSETDPVEGSRFARLPPKYARLPNGVLLPLRYKIEVGDLSEILVQNQVFTALGAATPVGELSFLAWSAPGPNPKVDPQGKLRIVSEEANAYVVARPEFPRENWLGFRWNGESVPLHPEIEVIREARSGRWVGSVALAPAEWLGLGALETTYVSRDPTLDSPVYSRDLTWVSFGPWPTRAALRGSLRWERHWGRGERGSWIAPSLSYSPTRVLQIQAQAAILAGNETGYFGSWRSLDSISVGTTLVW